MYVIWRTFDDRGWSRPRMSHTRGARPRCSTMHGIALHPMCLRAPQRTSGFFLWLGNISISRENRPLTVGRHAHPGTRTRLSKRWFEPFVKHELGGMILGVAQCCSRSYPAGTASSFKAVERVSWLRARFEAAPWAQTRNILARSRSVPPGLDKMSSAHVTCPYRLPLLELYACLQDNLTNGKGVSVDTVTWQSLTSWLGI